MVRAINQVQEKLYLEICDADQEVTETGEMEMTYDTTANLRYLDMVVHETMRHFPTCDAMRTCTKDYKKYAPEQAARREIQNCRNELTNAIQVPGTEFTIPKKMAVYVAAAGIMMDERYFPNPKEFNPENFSEKNKKERNPYASLIFGHGPRDATQ